jgi:hypothetical protein
VVGILGGLRPLRVVFVVVIDADSSPIVSSDQFSDLMRVPVDCVSRTFARNYDLLALLSLLAPNIVVQLLQLITKVHDTDFPTTAVIVPKSHDW